MYGEEIDPEEEFVMPPLPNHDLKIQPADKLESETLYIAFYGVSSLYAASLVDTQKPIARINFQKAKQKSLASVYANESEKAIFVIFNEEFEKMKEIHLADFIARQFEFKNLYILTSVAKGMLEKDDGISVKVVQTTNGTSSYLQKFDQGITGPAGDLLLWSQINARNAQCYIGIYSQYEVNRKIIDDIFSPISGSLKIEGRFDISKQIKMYNTSKSSNKLYL